MKMSEEDWSSIPLNPYKLMSKYMRLNKAAYIKDKLIHITCDFIEKQGLIDEYATFLEEWGQDWKRQIIRGEDFTFTHKRRETRSIN